MAIRTIEKIQVGSFPMGTAFGGHIYTSSVQLGVAGEKTTITLSIVNESGDYNINKGFLSTLVPYTVVMGDPNNTNGQIFFKSMYLTQFNYSDNIGARTLSVTFTDASIILDKIQVLLLNQQASPLNFVNGWKGTWNVGGSRIGRVAYVPVECAAPCASTGAKPWGVGARNPQTGESRHTGLKPNSAEVNYEVDKSISTNAITMAGGAIVIGEEEFIERRCDLPQISYTFNELLAALRGLCNIPVFGLSDRNRQPPIREKFAGSLREVLGQWCSLYGYSFIWDWSGDRIVGQDLLNPKFYIDDIKQKVSAIKEGTTSSPVTIANAEYGASLEGTYRKDHISTFIKPAKTQESSSSFSKRVFWEPLTISHIIPQNRFTEISGGRTEAELIVSSVLAKYNTTARTLYNYWLIAQKTKNFTENVDVYGKPLGMTIKSKLSTKQKHDLLNLCFSTQEADANETKYGKNGAIFLGTYSNEIESQWVNWEKAIANFIGQYYFIAKPFDDQFKCLEGFLHFVREWTTKPNATLYNKTNLHELPFKEILKHPEGAFAIANNTSVMKSGKFFLHSRTANYGFKDEELDDIWSDDGTEVLKDYLPSYAPIEGSAKLFLDKMIQQLFPDIYDKMDELDEENKRPSFLFFPEESSISEVLQFSPMQGTSGYAWSQANSLFPRKFFVNAPGNRFNKYEYVVKEEEGEESVKDKECNLFCDKDLFSVLCACPESEFYNPDQVGLTNPSARWFRMKIETPNKDATKRTVFHDFVLPSEYPFSGFVNIDTIMRRVRKSIYQHFGNLSHGANTLSYQVNIKDIAGDLDYMEEAENKQGGPVKPGEETGQIKPQIILPGYDEPINALDYHNIINSTFYNDLPRETLSFSMVGMDFSALWPYLNAGYGLESLQITLDENGAKVSFTYGSKPLQPPQDNFFAQKVNNVLNPNVFMR